MNEVVQDSVEVYSKEKKAEELKAEESLRRSEEKFRNIFEKASDCMIFLDVSGRILDVNEKAVEVYGGSKEELLGKHFTKVGVVSLRDIPKLLSAFASGLAGKRPTLSISIKNKKGREVLLECLSSLTRTRDKPTLVVIARDVTERKRMEEALRESEEKYRTQFEEALDAILVADAETGIIIDCNHAASELVDREKSELVGKHQRILHPPEEIEGEFSRTFKQHLQEKEGQVLETQVITKRGEIKDVAIKANVFELRGKKLIQRVFRDITERKEAEKAIRESQKKFERLFMFNPEAAVFSDVNDYVLDINPRFTELFGYSPDEAKGKFLDDLIVPEDLKEEAKRLTEIREGYVYHETVRKKKDGTLILVSISCASIVSDGKCLGNVVLYKDITERKEMEDKLKQYSEHLEELVQKRTDELLESEKRYSVLVEGANDGVIIAQDGKHVFANKKFSEIVGYSKDEIIGLPMEKIIDEKCLQLVKERDKRVIRGEKVPSTIEVELITKTEEHVPIEASSTLVQYLDRPATLVIVRDIRDRKRAEETRQRLEKLAAIGELATMVGHDLRNPLQSIENATYCLKTECATKRSCPISQKAGEMLQIIDESVNYADQIVRDLQDFSAPKTPTLEKAEINTLIKETLSQIKTPKNVEVITELDQLPEINVDKNQIKRVFLNLAKNGIEAMQKGGTLKISTKKANGFVHVSFKDTGVGISRESREKIFTPFFTTKAKGMGLGLSICKKFVENHGGTIQVESEVGKGSTFTVRLPIPQEDGGEKT